MLTFTTPLLFHRLRHNDRLALGYCAHIFVVVAPPAQQPKLQPPADNPPEVDTAETKKGLRFAFFRSPRPAQTLETMETSFDADRNVKSHVTYNSAVQEVMLLRQENEAEKKHRLASFVLNKWRLPQSRAAFEEQLLLAIHETQEANAIAFSVGAFVRFRIICGGLIDVQRLFSLRLEVRSTTKTRNSSIMTI